MQPVQQMVVVLFGLVNLFFFSKGFYESYKKKNAYGMTYLLFPFSIFVWGDAVVFGLFWTVVSVSVLLLQDWILFLLFLSLFYLIRSIGETIYWFNQQFSKVIRCDPEKYWTHKIFHNDSVWFVFQTVHQCITVVTLITSIYLARLWLTSLP